MSHAATMTTLLDAADITCCDTAIIAPPAIGCRRWQVRHTPLRHEGDADAALPPAMPPRAIYYASPLPRGVAASAAAESAIAEIPVIDYI